jgi:hypothetical protein
MPPVLSRLPWDPRKMSAEQREARVACFARKPLRRPRRWQSINAAFRRSAKDGPASADCVVENRVVITAVGRTCFG